MCVNTINYEYDGSGNRIKTYYAEGTGTKNIVSVLINEGI
jgi:hypothetical protein